MSRCVHGALGTVLAVLTVSTATAQPTGRPGGAPRAVLGGTIVDRVTQSPIGGARIAAAPGAREVLSDDRGRFRLELQPGTVEITIEAAAYQSLATTESLAANAELEVRYGLTPEMQGQYETVVTARAAREEVSRRRFEREEVTQTPGTMGDPFRIIETMPGVVPLLTGVPYYYIRGAPPADTGYFIDGIRVPALFHLAVGPSVIHPNLVDQVDFFAGGAPARYPGFVGGLVGASTASIPRDRLHLEVDARLVDAGAIASAPFDDGRLRVSLSGHYSYTAALLSLLQEDIFIDYWDYQLRVERDVGPRQTATLFVFGAFDDLGSFDDDGRREIEFEQVFHRLEGRYRWRLTGQRSLELAVAMGFEQALLADGDISTQQHAVGPRFTYRTPLGPDVDLQLGAEVLYQRSDFEARGEGTSPDEDPDLDEILAARGLGSAGAYAELAYRISPSTTLLPGLRLSGVYGNDTVYPALDPRLGYRHEVLQGVRIKGSVGLYHQPPAFVLPLPGLESLDFDRGLQRAVQLSQGVEWDPGLGLEVDAQVFYHRYENLSDISFGEDDIDDDEGFPRMTGNAYGLELIIRRPLTSRLFGWVAYTLSRSERLFGADEGRLASCDPNDGARMTRPAFLGASDTDRTHVLNVVASYRLPGDVRLGARLHYRSGRPFTRRRCVRFVGDFDEWTLTGPRNAERMPGFFRIDLRIDKRWHYARWELELYFEFINVTFAEEVIQMDQDPRADGTYGPPTVPDDAFPLVIPTFGVRGVF